MNNTNHKYMQPYRYDDEEILTYASYQILVAKKAIIFSVLALTLIIAIIFLIFTDPIYEAKVRLLLPKTNTMGMTISKFQFEMKNIYEETQPKISLSEPDHPFALFDPQTIFTDFIGQLNSMGQWRLFVEKNPSLFNSFSNTQLIEILEEHPVKLKKEKNYPAEHIIAAYQSNKATNATDTLQRYLQFTEENFIADHVNLVRLRIERQEKNLTADIVMMRQQARMAREDEIERLNRDLSLAKTLGIRDNLLLRRDDNSGAGIAIIAPTEIFRGYMRGEKSISAEVETLVKRKSDDPYIDGLREKQIELQRLNNLRINPENFMPFTQDEKNIIPQDPIKPKKTITIALSLILGLVLGIFAALFYNFIDKVKKAKIANQERPDLHTFQQ